MCKDNDAYLVGIKKAKKHKTVSHYTTFDALKTILENKSLRLTRLNQVNDVYEEERIDYVWKGKIFIASFTYRETESNMFWSLYAKENGVMLTFDNEAIYKSDSDIYADAACENVFQHYEKSDASYTRNLDYLDWLLRNKSYADVTYTSDFKKYRGVYPDLQSIFKNCIVLSSNKDFSFSLNPGLIKGIEWDSEQEVRIRVALSYKGMSNSPETGSPSTNFEYVYTPFADALKTMTVTMNPWHSDCFAEKLNDLLNNNPLTKKCEIKESSMRYQVRR